jgi:hypothetical protein
MLKAVRNTTEESFPAQLRALYLARVNLHSGPLAQKSTINAPEIV